MMVVVLSAGVDVVVIVVKGVGVGVSSSLFSWSFCVAARDEGDDERLLQEDGITVAAALVDRSNKRGEGRTFLVLSCLQ